MPPDPKEYRLLACVRDVCPDPVLRVHGELATTTFVRGVFLAITAVGVSSCAFFNREVVLPTHALPANAAGDATGGRVGLEGQCVFLEYEGGSRANLLWSPGYSATGPPLVIRDSSGRDIIVEGDDIELSVADVTGTAVPGCPPRHTWAIGEIGRVNGVALPSSPVGPDRPQKPPR